MVNPRNSSQIRRSNIQTLLASIRQNGPISKRDLQKLTGLSWGAVSSLTGLLHESGYVVYTGKQITNMGRKPSELDINPDDHYLIGVDLNLSGICGVVTDMKGRIVREWLRLFARNEYDCIMETLFSLLDEILHEVFPHKHIIGIGLAVQGFVDIENGLSTYFPHVQHWKDVPLRRILEQRYGYPTLLMHDPHCIMVAERAFGNSFMRIAQNAVMIRLDNGIGMSLMANGQLYLGANGKSGEFGHIPIDPDGPLCSCGNRGCLDEYVSGNGLVRRFIELVNQGRETSADIDSIGNTGYKTLGAAGLSGDPLCLELFRQMGEYLGLSLSILFNMFNPDLVVLYGDLTAYRALFTDAMEKQLASHVYAGIPVKLDYSELGRNAAAQGVALLVSNQAIEELDLGEGEAVAAEGQRPGEVTRYGNAVDVRD